MIEWDQNKPPSYSVKRLTKIYDMVYTYLDKGRHKRYTDVKRLDYLCGGLACCLGVTSRESKDVIRTICTSFERSSLIARAIAGWYDEIKEGQLFRKWSPAHGPSWALLFVENVLPTTYTKKTMFTCTFWSLTGPTVNTIWQRPFPPSFCQKIIRETGGLKRSKYFPEDVGGLYLTTAIKDTKRGISFDMIHATPSQHSLNRSLLKARKNLCLKDKYSSQGRQCFPCEMGRDRCPIARQKDTLPIAMCVNPYPFKHTGAILYRGLCKDCVKRGVAKKVKVNELNKIHSPVQKSPKPTHEVAV